tara:strand:+ start:524 stop:790 length:267 start_codon:yes stop_codon:yes gene_type:complete
MSRFHTTPDGDVPFTPEEEIARELEESGAIAAKPMNAWKKDMQATDSTCPRWFEDMYDALPLEIRDSVAPVTKNMLVNKKATRQLRPV